MAEEIDALSRPTPNIELLSMSRIQFNQYIQSCNLKHDIYKISVLVTTVEGSPDLLGGPAARGSCKPGVLQA